MTICPWADFLANVDNVTNYSLSWTAVPSKELQIWVQTYGFWLELFISTLGVFEITVISLMFFVFSKSPQFHFHLICLIHIIFIFAQAFSVVRIAIMIASMLQTEPLILRPLVQQNLICLEHLKLVVGVAYVGSIPCFILERFLATMKLSTYEKTRSCSFVIVCLLVMVACGLFFGTFIFWRPDAVIYGAAAGCAAGLLKNVSFFFVDRVNQRMYDASSKIGNSFSLSERFQLGENIRVAKLLRASIWCSHIWNAIAFVVFCAFWTCSDLTYKRLLKLLFELCISLYALSFVTVALQSCPVWKRTFFGLILFGFKLKSRYRVSASVSSTDRRLRTDILKTCKGEPMVFSIEKQRELYFEHLKSSWD